MKRIFVNGRATDFFFSKEASFDDMFEWIQEQVMFDSQNIFNLNEQRSCSVSNSTGLCSIRGDEDSFKRITVENITPIL